MNGIYYQYLQDVSRYKLLTRDEEKYLISESAKGNQLAINKLVESNLKFVINVANMYKDSTLSLTELINEGNLGLIEAAKRFDPNQKIKFISYAVWWIRQSINRAISEKARMVRISAEKELVLRRFNRAHVPMTQVIGGHILPDIQALSNKMGYSPKQVENILSMGMKHTSLDNSIDDNDESSIMDLIAGDGPLPDVMIEKESENNYLNEMIQTLNPQEQLVIKMYFGISKDHSLNLLEIGKIIGLSKERVRQVKENALQKLRNEINRKNISHAA
jgi:RNA polymerase primary sigma factor